nr:immunoglobulin heavy chain junction region [Mus musculus]
CTRNGYYWYFDVW